jgi:hypothetical protein
MFTLSDVFRTYGPAYLEKYGFVEQLSADESTNDEAVVGPVCPDCGAPMHVRSLHLPGGLIVVPIDDTG